MVFLIAIDLYTFFYLGYLSILLEVGQITANPSIFGWILS